MYLNNIYATMKEDKLYDQMYEIHKLMKHPLFIKRLERIINIFSLLTKSISLNKYKRILALIKHPLDTYILLKQSIDLEKSFRYSDAEEKYFIKHEPLTPQEKINKRQLLVPKDGDFQRIQSLNWKMKHLETENLENYYTLKLGQKVYNDLINEQNG